MKLNMNEMKLKHKKAHTNHKVITRIYNFFFFEEIRIYNLTKKITNFLMIYQIWICSGMGLLFSHVSCFSQFLWYIHNIILQCFYKKNLDDRQLLVII